MGDESAIDRIKFLCSYGGRILPRPTDGQLKYVGGDTRVFAVPRSVSFSELKKRLTSAFNGEMAIKYRLMPDDLDVLVSVKTDEDVRHMIDEYDRQDSATAGGGSPRFRVFLFQFNETTAPSTVASHRAVGGGPQQSNITSVEQRYVDAINGMRVPARKFFPSSLSSPTSTTTAESAGLEWRHPMPKAHSSPNLRGMGHQATAAPLGHGHHHHHQHQHWRVPRPRQCPGYGAVGMSRTGSPPFGTYENEMCPVGRRHFGPLAENGNRRGIPGGHHASSYFGRQQEELCSCSSRKLL